jgi:hypothetical protein
MPAQYPVNPDLSLVSIETLAGEIMKRCATSLIVTSIVEGPEDPVVSVTWGGGVLGALGLAVVAQDFLTQKIGGYEEQ